MNEIPEYMKQMLMIRYAKSFKRMEEVLVKFLVENNVNANGLYEIRVEPTIIVTKFRSHKENE